MTADNEQVSSTDASAHVAAQLRRGANSTGRAEPGTGPVTGVNGRGASLLAPDAGRAEVFGHDVVREPAAVRELIGLTGQFAAVDELLTGRENLSAGAVSLSRRAW